MTAGVATGEAAPLPAGQIVAISGIDIRALPGPHPVETDVAGIDAHWATMRAAKPALFDGRIMLFSQIGLASTRLVARCHETRYATFLYWRDRLTRQGAGHLYGHAVIVSADGVLMAVRMADSTLNGGLVYFAAGSLEPEDFSDGVCDLHGNMRREVLEETRLDIDAMEPEATTQVLALGTGTVVFRRFRSALTAAQLERSIEAHVAAEADPEITGAVPIRSVADMAGLRLPEQMPHIVRWCFERSQAKPA